jgi:hypothetical protein
MLTRTALVTVCCAAALLAAACGGSKSAATTNQAVFTTGPVQQTKLSISSNSPDWVRSRALALAAELHDPTPASIHATTRKNVVTIVLRGHFLCDEACSHPIGGKAPQGSLATERIAAPTGVVIGFHFQKG